MAESGCDSHCPISEIAGARDEWRPLCSSPTTARSWTSLRRYVITPSSIVQAVLLALNNQRHLRPAHEMAALFRDIPDAIANTVELSSRLAIRAQ